MHKWTDTWHIYPHNGNAHLAANMWLLMMGIDELETTVVDVVVSYIPHLVVFHEYIVFFYTKYQSVVICWLGMV